MRTVGKVLPCQSVLLEELREKRGELLQRDARIIDEGRKQKLLSNSEYKSGLNANGNCTEYTRNA